MALSVDAMDGAIHSVIEKDEEIKNAMAAETMTVTADINLNIMQDYAMDNVMGDWQLKQAAENPQEEEGASTLIVNDYGSLTKES